MNRIFILSLSLLLFTGAMSCKKRVVIGTSDEEAEKILTARREELEKKLKDHYDIPGTSSSAEEAVQKFLDQISKSAAQDNPYVFSREEYLDIYWPNNPDIYTMNLGLSPEMSWEIESVGRSYLFPGFSNNVLKHRPVRVIRIEYEREPLEYGVLKIHLPKYILIDAGGEEIRLKFIRVIVEHDHKFKVCSVRKD